MNTKWTSLVLNPFTKPLGLALLLLGLAAPVHSQTADDFNPGANGRVFSLAVQADRKMLVGGSFSMLGGQTRNCIGRLNADGTLESTFNPGASSTVYSLAVQADGKLLVGGSFSTLGGQTRNCIGRLNADGTLDSTFNPGASGSVYSLAVQADGKILVGGYFTTLGGYTRNYLGRLNPAGTLDSTFNPGAGSDVLSLAVQADGKILVGGYFTTLGGQTRNYLGRLNADGTLDSTFNPGASGSVYSLAVQADGKILVGGYFTTLGGYTRNYLGRLNPAGTLDSTFNPGAGSDVLSLAVQADGKILVGGYFTTLGGQTRNYLGRLNADGTLDSGFNPGASSTVYSLAVQVDGKILVGGRFTTIAGQTRNYLGRLNNTEPATQSLSYDGSTITWLRGGTSPEVWRTTFDWSTNGITWTSLGAGTRIPGGWRLADVSVPPDGTIHVRGQVTGGYQNASSWFVEAYSGPILFINQPASRTNDAGTTAAFSVIVACTEPFGYQWLKNGLALADGGRITGALTSTLAVSNVFGGDSGAGYSVVVTNAQGSMTSAVAVLTVRDPFISSQPASQITNAGNSVSFSVAAVGTGPLNYQWRKEGGPLAGATALSLILTNLQLADIGNYDIVVTNVFGNVTSAVAVLTVRDPFITVQPASQLKNPGDSASFNVTAAGTAPLSYQWRKEGGPLAGATASSLILTNLQLADAGNYDVVVSHVFGSVTSAVAELSMNLATLDSFNPAASSSVFSLAAQADGKVLVGGQFTTLCGQTRNYLGRLNADGTLDSNFNPGAGGVYSMYGTVVSLAVQTDGKILAGGWFTTLGGQTRNGIGRLNADGTLDSTFNPGASGSVVYSLAVQADGKILVGGDFTTLGGQVRNYLGRLNADGTLDSTFNPAANSSVYSLAVQADGKILVGGSFITLGGEPRNRIGRLNADGTLDSTFNPGASGDSYPDVYSLAVQADGKILVGGDFTTLGGQTRNRIGRLNADGTLDSTFNPGANAYVYSLVMQADGKILVGGYFTTLGGQTRNRIGRLNADGTLDSTFNPEADSSVYSLAVQADGKILVGGYFTTLGGQTRNRLGRLNNTEPATQSLSYDGSTITWLRGGTSPEVCRSTFDYCSDGLTWTNLGTGTPIPGGWQVAGVSLPPGGTIRARGQVTGGYHNASGWFVETYTGAPVFIILPASRTNDTGTTATFSVVARGPEPLSYQWLKDGVPLVDGGGIAGATASILALSSVFKSAEGGYSVVVTNGFGSVTSAVAILTVNLVATPDTGFNPGASGSVYSLAMQADGKILVGGGFTTLGGQTRNYLGRLNADGTLDSTFNPGASSYVYSLAMQADGKILVGGGF
ncbi:MAG: immunoglobulin domain-containing protein, partial [Verrucomicrobiota bacterium]